MSLLFGEEDGAWGMRYHTFTGGQRDDQLARVWQNCREEWLARERLCDYIGPKGFFIDDAIRKIYASGENAIPNRIIGPVLAYIKKDEQRMKDLLPDDLLIALKNRMIMQKQGLELAEEVYEILEKE
ncbi:MAG: hypothetical protein KAT77_03785 [Nanoarchaeota archaeon]|nr:hypothetical protein [Nanoarchaeota archaeon]